jgi:hypothetical protein
MRKRGEVLLKALPPGFVDDLPDDDQRALLAAVGKLVALNGYDEDGRAELEFVDHEGVDHTIWLDPQFFIDGNS